MNQQNNICLKCDIDDIPLNLSFHFHSQENGQDVCIYLTAKNPQAPRRKIQFDHDTRSFVRLKDIKTMIDHLEIESTCIHKKSPEAKTQIKQNRTPSRSVGIRLILKFSSCPI